MYTYLIHPHKYILIFIYKYMCVFMYVCMSLQYNAYFPTPLIFE